MRIFILTNNDLTSNIIFSGLFEKKGVEIIGVGFTTTFTQKKSGIAGVIKLLKKMDWHYWLYLVFVNFFFSLYKKMSAFFWRQNSSSLKALELLCKEKEVPIYYSNDFNSKEFLYILKEAKPDLIIERIDQVLKAGLLNIPRIGTWCIHSGLLPSYKGIAAEFHAIRNKETVLGTTIFEVALKLDTGKSLYQVAMPLQPGKSVFFHMLKNNVSARDLLLNSINELNQKTGGGTEIVNTTEESYYSWPTKDDMKEFNLAKLELITRGEILNHIASCFCLKPFSL